jgi:ABC-type Zn uptake system ZnuABC Zn-binding protein ZnuA
LGYYADHYKLTVIGAVIPGYSSMAAPSAQEMVALQEAIKSYNVKAVFVGTTVNPNLSKQVSQDMGVQLIPLYTESLGASGSGAETYLDYMRYNTTAIVQGLK